MLSDKKEDRSPTMSDQETSTYKKHLKEGATFPGKDSQR